jgi:hypothetical protein
MELYFSKAIAMVSPIKLKVSSFFSFSFKIPIDQCCWSHFGFNLYENQLIVLRK